MKQAVAVVKKILQGMHDSQGRRAYFAPAPGAQMIEAHTGYNATSKQWGLSVISLGGVFIEVEINMLNGSNIPNLNGVTYDMLKDWITEGMQRFQGVLETTWPDLTPYKNAGGKVLMFHGESDWGIPTASSVRYWESVRKVMNPGKSYNDSAAAQNEFFKLFLVAGATHCAANPFQPKGSFPQTNWAVMIDWVENGKAPQALNATILRGKNKGGSQQICAWPLRPAWGANATSLNCRYDQKSVDYWNYDLVAFNVPIYYFAHPRGESQWVNGGPSTEGMGIDGAPPEIRPGRQKGRFVGDRRERLKQAPWRQLGDTIHRLFPAAPEDLACGTGGSLPCLRGRLLLVSPPNGCVDSCVFNNDVGSFGCS